MRQHNVSLLAGLGLALALAAPASATPPAHVVLVIEENHGFSQIIGSPECPFINALAAKGTLLTQSYAVTHPSLPNYLALFSGSIQGVKGDPCPPPGSPYSGANLASQLRASGYSFAGFSDGLPYIGSQDCSDTAKSGYRRKHNPWADFANLPPETNLPFQDFPSDYLRLPVFSIVVPDMSHDMHDGSPAEADAWLKASLSGYADWCLSHNSVLIVTFDEDNGAEENRIPTLILGQAVKVGKLDTKVDHYGMLRTLCSWWGLEPMGEAAKAHVLEGIFR